MSHLEASYGKKIKKNKDSHLLRYLNGILSDKKSSILRHKLHGDVIHI